MVILTMMCIAAIVRFIKREPKIIHKKLISIEERQQRMEKIVDNVVGVIGLIGIFLLAVHIFF